jgi:hypothetical protein
MVDELMKHKKSEAMKTIFTRLIFIWMPLLVTLGCTRTEWTDIKTLKPGYTAVSDSSKVSLVLTKDDVTGAVTYDPVGIRLRYFFSSQVAGYRTAGITKILQNENYEPVASTEQALFTDLSDTVRIDLLTMDSLFSGLDFHPDSIRSGFSFLFKTFMVQESGDTIVSSRGDYLVSPEYINFCTLPVIPEGVWEAHNKATGFKKDIEIRSIELAPSFFMLVFTDFGIDWSRWNDFWYGTDFTIGCPLAGDDRYVVKLAAWGIDLSYMRLQMNNDKGEPETRPLRIMPWAYAADSPDIGYYDANARRFIFKNVKITDTWWNIDNYTIEEVTFTYKGQ